MHLVALKKSLRSLNLAVNLRINDDCVPSIMALENVKSLSMRATNLSINGLRRLCGRMAHAGEIALEIPVGCTDYLRGKLE